MLAVGPYCFYVSAKITSISKKNRSLMLFQAKYLAKLQKMRRSQILYATLFSSIGKHHDQQKELAWVQPYQVTWLKFAQPKVTYCFMRNFFQRVLILCFIYTIHVVGCSTRCFMKYLEIYRNKNELIRQI